MSYTNGLDKPTDYFNTKLYTGTGATRSITGIGFQPDWIWTKGRSGTYSSESHKLYDSVRGATKELRSDVNNAESTNSGGVTSFDSDGYGLGVGGGVNGSSTEYVSWNWLAGTSVSGNTGGSGTAKTYTGSVNTDAGFSIIRYIGNGTAGHTIPHHLGTTPAWVIARTISAAKEWDVYHHKNTSSPETDYLVLNTTAATTDASDKWNDTAPTSSVVTLGESSQLNTNDGTCIMYAFAEKKGYSKFGSYTGNNSSDGTFVYLGFKPAWIMVKRTGTEDTSSNMNGSHWVMLDNKRDPSNDAGTGNVLTANRSNAEDTTNLTDVEFLSNGFKFRGGADAVNASDTYIFMAFAENPFVTSTGIPCTAR